MNDSLIALTKDTLGALRDLLPIILVISVFQIFVFRVPIPGLATIIVGSVFVVAGLALFIFGSGSPCSPSARVSHIRWPKKAAYSGL